MQTYFLLRFSLMDLLKFVLKLTFRLFKKVNFRNPDEKPRSQADWRKYILEFIEFFKNYDREI